MHRRKALIYPVYQIPKQTTMYLKYGSLRKTLTYLEYGSLRKTLRKALRRKSVRDLWARTLTLGASFLMSATRGTVKGDFVSPDRFNDFTNLWIDCTRRRRRKRRRSRRRRRRRRRRGRL